MGDRFSNADPGNDNGGLAGHRDVTGFDPTSKGFYNGGDLEACAHGSTTSRDSAPTPIWLTPIFKNKPVQLEDGPSAGYHGYWITDFTQVDPHLGTNQDLRDLVDEAHERGIKVFFDIITNHTADVIGYDRGRSYGVRPQGPGALPRRRGPPVRRPRLRRHRRFPELDPARRSRTCPSSTRARRTSRSPPGSTTRRTTTTAATRRSPVRTASTATSSDSTTSSPRSPRSSTG